MPLHRPGGRLSRRRCPGAVVCGSLEESLPSARREPAKRARANGRRMRIGAGSPTSFGQGQTLLLPQRCV
ncbi:hypothetical protein MRX96_018545 [Rhipicephalus microplus]